MKAKERKTGQTTCNNNNEQRVDLLEHLAQFLLLLLLLIPTQAAASELQQLQLRQLPPRRAVRLAQAEAVVPRFSQLVGTIKAWAAPWRKAVRLQNPLPSVCWHTHLVSNTYSNYPFDLTPYPVNGLKRKGASESPNRYADLQIRVQFTQSLFKDTTQKCFVL